LQAPGQFTGADAGLLTQRQAQVVQGELAGTHESLVGYEQIFASIIYTYMSIKQ
jgi:hypothetical protein